jgi:hypothetical protein
MSDPKPPPLPPETPDPTAIARKVFAWCGTAIGILVVLGDFLNYLVVLSKTTRWGLPTPAPTFAHLIVFIAGVHLILLSQLYAEASRR